MTTYLLELLILIAISACCAEQQIAIPKWMNSDLSKTSDEKLSVGRSLIDTIIDLALEKIKTEVNEPIDLQDELALFNKSFLFIPIRGEVALYSGKLFGVRTIQRANDAHFTVHNFHDVDVNCSFLFENLNFTYNFQANLYNKISTDGRVIGNMMQLLADASMDIDLKNKTIELTSLTLKTAKSITLQLQSEKYVDKFFNFVIKLITSNFKATILAQIEKELHSILKQKFHY